MARIDFRNPEIAGVNLDEMALSWRGLYSISPDEHWILRTQKTGSGENVAILYRVEKNGRVMEVRGFNALLWSTSDKISKLKLAALYHSGVGTPKWSEDGKTISLVLHGTSDDQSENGIELRLIYNLESHSVTPDVERADAPESTSPDPRPKH